MVDEFAYTESMNRLIEEFSHLPGIGRRTAERLSFHVLKAETDEAMKLAKAIETVKRNVRHCRACYNLTESDPCRICGDDRRDQRKIMVVEQPRDVISLEQTHVYEGVYHVLLGHLSPLEGIEVGDLTIGALVERVEAMASDEDGKVEVILGMNPNMEGDGTSLYIAEQLAMIDGDVVVTRLARGLPAGTQLEYANKSVLSDAITSRRELL